ncbi:AraC family transcriptional regulator [Chitinophaga pinensis]|uniref:Transcriptional regulator, AraC family n=1 Tax=Chitinophaga pinensis (strain ATCC 43595 / DSM 2588 / LMG 13176 / NBRC 15968 / NCIMB 11800 / UQM 2034) TaxID=485918 RepID=A0A979G1J8_CHIPD|nr:helix-turn-helix domain-containing protein [Chitinophaga pinensis]ACU59190.1 transcriptional regulator, AraC family [Chitinophaga pinensis DSM 2588]
MPSQTLDSRTIDTLRDLPDLIPVFREYFEDWTIRVFDREIHECRNYLSPNRRDFYKILFTTKGAGVFTMGLNTYYLDEPSILFIHPNDIISWRNLSEESGGYYCLFRRSFLTEFPALKAGMDKFSLFTDKSKSVIRIPAAEVPVLEQLFARMKAEEVTGGKLSGDSMQAYLQLIMVESVKRASFPPPDNVSEEYRHVHEFFRLLEEETGGINREHPIRIRTAKEFAADLSVHPNHLNALLKKHTGQNVSTHIKNRLLDETKVFLLQTDWSLQEIGYSIGFAEQPNFNAFFKKNTGLTPAEFRKNYLYHS